MTYRRPPPHRTTVLTGALCACLLLITAAPASARLVRPPRDRMTTASVALPQWSADTDAQILAATKAAREAQAELRRLEEANPLKNLAPGQMPPPEAVKWRAQVDAAERKATLAQERLAFASAGEFTASEQAALRPVSGRYAEIESSIREVAKLDKNAEKLLDQMREAREYMNGALKNVVKDGMPSGATDIAKSQDLWMIAMMGMLHRRLESDLQGVNTKAGREKQAIMRMLEESRETLRNVYDERVERGIQRINEELAREGVVGEFSIGRPTTENKRELIERRLQDLIHELIGGDPLEQLRRSKLPTPTPDALKQVGNYLGEVYRDLAAVEPKFGYKTAGHTLAVAFEKEGVVHSRKHLGSWGQWLYLQWTKGARPFYKRYIRTFQATHAAIRARKSVDPATMKAIAAGIAEYRTRQRMIREYLTQLVYWTARQAKHMDDRHAGSTAAGPLVKDADRKAREYASQIAALSAKPRFTLPK